MIIFLMAGIAGGGGALEDIIGMTGSTSRLDMRAG